MIRFQMFRTRNSRRFLLANNQLKDKGCMKIFKALIRNKTLKYLNVDNKMILVYNQINADEIVSWIYNCAYINEKQ